MAIQEIPILAVTGFFTIAVGLLLLLVAYQQAKAKNFKNHKNIMLGAALVNGAFLIQYITRFFMGQETRFPGPISIRNFVYIPILVVHITGAVITIVLVLVHLKRSLGHEKQTPVGEPFFEPEYAPQHRSLGRITFYFWAASFIGGITVFLLLYIIF